MEISLSLYLNWLIITFGLYLIPPIRLNLLRAIIYQALLCMYQLWRWWETGKPGVLHEVHGVKKSWTRLSNWTTITSYSTWNFICFLPMVLKLNHLGLWKHRCCHCCFWVGRSGMRSESLHFWRAPKWCSCYWSWGHTVLPWLVKKSDEFVDKTKGRRA